MAMLVLPHNGYPETVGADVAISIFPPHGDPRKVGVMKPLLILFTEKALHKWCLFAD